MISRDPKDQSPHRSVRRARGDARRRAVSRNVVGAMKLIAHGDIYDLPPYAECDLDALIVGVALPNMVVDTLVALAHMLGVPVLRSDVARNLLPLDLPADSCACTHVGAGFTAPVSGLDTAPGAPNETRHP